VSACPVRRFRWARIVLRACRRSEQMWRDCGGWMTDELCGYPECSQQTFAHVYEHASDELLAWVRDIGTGTGAGVRWLYDLGRYVRHRSKAEGRAIALPQIGAQCVSV